MTGPRLADRITALPTSPNGQEVERRLSEAAERRDEGASFELLMGDAAAWSFLKSALGDCPYLLDLAEKDLGRLVDIMRSPPEDFVEQAIHDLAHSEWLDRADAMRDLRRSKQAVALSLALADLARSIDLDVVTGSLSRFADAALNAALRYALGEAARQGKWVGEIDVDASGFFVLAMGKYGAYELNYSSDIDLIAVYDSRGGSLADGEEPSTFWVRIVRLLVLLLQERTLDGYVFRVDLRLRPDPGATPVAISIDGALQYYESMGQNWERAALIKARPASGDRECGWGFLKEIEPFIWRKYFDFAAIADIHSIKRQIHDKSGHASVRIAGHDIKRGRGGIREVELFAQTQQMIGGGRDPDLRNRRTLNALKTLTEKRWVTADVSRTLNEAYVFLRDLEHRLQMVRDEQTQIVPADEADRAAVGRLCGFENLADFDAALRSELDKVAGIYSTLFESEPSLSGETGNLVFTGTDDDPETLATLTAMGFDNPSGAIATVSTWQFGRYAATRTPIARQRLTELTPALLQAFAKVGSPDAALRSFDGFLKGLPAGVQLFAILGSHPELMELLALILGAAPRLAEAFVRHPHIVDALIDPRLPDETVRRDDLIDLLTASLGDAASYEDALNRVRNFVNEQTFLISVWGLMQTLSSREAAIAYSTLADVVCEKLLACVASEFSERHGRVKGGRIAVLSLGRLGSREMTATSDLDLIILYDHDEDAIASDGERPLSASQYYSRLTQRFIAALSAPTSAGIAYEVDLRLRPSGRSGPVASHIDAFRHYQAEEAWTWEHMALTRARANAGNPDLRREAEAIIAEVLSRPNDPTVIKADVLEMHGKFMKAHEKAEPWSLKTARGGLVDGEFAAQSAILCGLPWICGEPAVEILLRAADASEDPEPYRVLAKSMAFQSILFQALRGADDRPFDPETAPEGLKRHLVDMVSRNCETVPEKTEDDKMVMSQSPVSKSAPITVFSDLNNRLRETQDAARTAFDRIMGEPAD